MTRNISGKGVLICPPSVVGYRYQLLNCSVIRDASTPYRNFNWSPNRGQFANLVFLQNEYVISVQRMEFPKQRFQTLPDPTGEILLALRCVEYADLYSFAVVLKQLGGVAITASNPIADYAPLNLGWDSVQVDCFSDCALEVSLTTEEYDSCSIKDAPTPPTPPPEKPPTPEPPPKVKPGTPLPPSGPGSLSPAYDGKDDGGKTIPHPLDTPSPGSGGSPSPTPSPTPSPSIGNKCQKILIKCAIKSTGFSPPNFERDVSIYGEFTGELVPFRVDTPGGSRVGFKIGCRGFTDSVCGDAALYEYDILVGGLPANLKVDSVSLIDYTLLN